MELVWQKGFGLELAEVWPVLSTGRGSRVCFYLLVQTYLYNPRDYRQQTNQYFVENIGAVVSVVRRGCFSYFQRRLSGNKRQQPRVSA